MAEDRGEGTEGTKRPATERADDLLNRASWAAGFFASMIGVRLARVVAFAREEAEDLWAEAQSMRQQNAGAEPGEDASVRTSEEIGAPRREAEEHEAEQEAKPKERAKNSEYVIRTGDYVGAAGRKEEESDAVSGQETESHGEEGTTIKATEEAFRHAEELGVDLREVEGTGADGQITVGDVRKKAEAEA
jgi:pyruvate dehydrogenase E2 component (dihydrolipoamide acetyltransferase)